MKSSYYSRNKAKMYAKAKERLADPARRLQRLQYMRIYYFRLRVEVLSHYGNACACCGEDDFRFLCLDHINGDGAAHRRSLSIAGGGGAAMYLRLRKEGYPTGFQVLCFNCNFAKGIYCACPHQLSNEPIASLLYQTRSAWGDGIYQFDKKQKAKQEVGLLPQ